MSPGIKVSIIVPVKNNRQGIEKLLASLFKLRISKKSREIIIVDNGSTDGTLDFLKSQHGIILLTEERFSCSYAARNRGIAASRGEILAFTDSDCEVHPDWLRNGLKVFDSKKCDIVAGHIVRVLPQKPRTIDIVDERIYLRNDLYHSLGVSATANTFFRKKCFEKLGFFPSNIRAGGDWRWTALATRSGLKLHFCKETIVYHKTHSLRSFAKKMFRGGWCFFEVQHAIDPSGKSFWSGVKGCISLKSFDFVRKKFATSKNSRINFFVFKAWFLFHFLGWIKFLGILSGLPKISRGLLSKNFDKGELFVGLNEPVNRSNPYQELFYREWEKYHLHLSPLPNGLSVTQSLLSPIDILHVHWCPVNEKSFTESLRDISKFFLSLCFLKIRGVKIFWTAHNLLPHDYQRFTFQYIKRFILIHFSDLIIVHFQDAKVQLKRLFYVSPKKMALLQTGLYDTSYENTLDQKAARDILGIAEDKIVFLHFGEIRKYKNVEGLIRAFKLLDRQDAVLLIAGRTWSESYKNEILKLIGNDPRIKTSFGFVPDAKVQLYFNASDCVVLPYMNIFTSGSAMLAMTFKKPMIMKECSFSLEYLNESNSLLIKRVGRESIRQALEQFIIKRTELSFTDDYLVKFKWDRTVSALMNEPRAKSVILPMLKRKKRLLQIPSTP
jgi:glycosyltransferase involved in cell wall biosynthesis